MGAVHALMLPSRRTLALAVLCVVCSNERLRSMMWAYCRPLMRRLGKRLRFLDPAVQSLVEVLVGVLDALRSWLVLCLNRERQPLTAGGRGESTAEVERK